MSDPTSKSREFWDNHAKRDPLWAILSDPSKAGRGWNLQDFLETGRREVSLLMYQLRALDIQVNRKAALDFGCGVGRLSQPLAHYFEKIVGVDVSPEMIRLAEEINQHPGRVHYLCNTHNDLAVLSTNQFTFMYSNVVLQHIEPDAALLYLRELIRVVAPGGILVFQLPSHERPSAERRQTCRPMAPEAYRAVIQVEGDRLSDVAPKDEILLAVSVSNASSHTWSQQETGLMRLGNHWLVDERDEMLIQDDGRTALPDMLGPGETCRLVLKVTAPPEPGDYQLQLDLVHEAVSWFADRGSDTWRGSVRVVGRSEPLATGFADIPIHPVRTLPLADEASLLEVGDLPMFGIHCDSVEALVNQQGARIVHREIDERCGDEWIGYRYFVRKQ